MAATDSARPDIRAAELNDHDAIVGPALRAWAPVYPSVHDALGPELARLCSPTTRSSPSTRPGVPARPVSTASPQQVWSAELRDGSTVVALFDLDATAAAATADRGDLGLSGPLSAHDVWQHSTATQGDAISEQLPAHGSAPFRVRTTQQE